jgi:RHS repeat-associated protein
MADQGKKVTGRIDDSNNRNQMNSITAGGSSLATYSYDANGNAVSKSLSNGTLSSYTYDVANRLTTLNHTLSGTSFARFDYGYDTVNRRTYEERNSASGDTYSYDAVDQVASVNYDATNPASGSTGADRTTGYTYDASGNRTAVTDSVNGNTSYTANNLNQYSSVGGSAYAYDGNGNLVTGNGLYIYDAQNRLNYAQQGSTIDQISYDSKNRVVERTVNGTPTFYIYDANGNVMDLTNASGTVVEKYKYDAFGKPSITDGSGNPLTASAYGNRFLFTGREYLSELNLYDYRNRVYSADLGRFLQTDPMRFDAGDVNIYRYCGNDPINNIDPIGLCPLDPNDPNYNLTLNGNYNSPSDPNDPQLTLNGNYGAPQDPNNPQLTLNGNYGSASSSSGEDSSGANNVTTPSGGPAANPEFTSPPPDNSLSGLANSFINSTPYYDGNTSSSDLQINSTLSINSTSDGGNYDSGGSLPNGQNTQNSYLGLKASF